MLPSVLVLSKSILARRAIAETLRTAGFTVVEADGVEEAHALLSHFTPDAAVIDADNCRAEVVAKSKVDHNCATKVATIWRGARPIRR